MGVFSWITQDTGRSISAHDSERGSFKVHLLDDKGNKWTEEKYEGYGKFGGKDYYVLLAEMNGYDEDDFNTTDELRNRGINLSFDGLSGTLYPNLAEDPNWKWINERPDDCPNQGYFYDYEDYNEEEE